MPCQFVTSLCKKVALHFKNGNTIHSCNVIQVEGSQGRHHLYLNTLHGCKVKHSKHVKGRTKSPSPFRNTDQG